MAGFEKHPGRNVPGILPPHMREGPHLASPDGAPRACGWIIPGTFPPRVGFGRHIPSSRWVREAHSTLAAGSRGHSFFRCCRRAHSLLPLVTGTIGPRGGSGTYILFAKWGLAELGGWVETWIPPGPHEAPALTRTVPMIQRLNYTKAGYLPLGAVALH